MTNRERLEKALIDLYPQELKCMDDKKLALKVCSNTKFHCAHCPAKTLCDNNTGVSCSQVLYLYMQRDKN